MDSETMQAGREFDARIHEHVMRREVKYADHVPPGRWEYSASESGTPFDEVPHYTTDIAAAWQVVEALRALGFDIDVSAGVNCRLAWECTIAPRPNTDGFYVGEGSTAPLAICRAALKARPAT